MFLLSCHDNSFFFSDQQYLCIWILTSAHGWHIQGESWINVGEMQQRRLIQLMGAVKSMMWPSQSQIAAQLNSYGTSWSDMFDSSLHHHRQRNMFQKSVVHPSRRLPHAFRHYDFLKRLFWSCSKTAFLCFLTHQQQRSLVPMVGFGITRANVWPLSQTFWKVFL